MLNILMKLNAFLYKWYKLSTLKLDKNYLRNNYEYVFIRLELEDCRVRALGQILHLPPCTQLHNNALKHIMTIESQYLENSNSFLLLLQSTKPFTESTFFFFFSIIFFFLSSTWPVIQHSMCLNQRQSQLSNQSQSVGQPFLVDRNVVQILTCT